MKLDPRLDEEDLKFKGKEMKDHLDKAKENDDYRCNCSYNHNSNLSKHVVISTSQTKTVYITIKQTRIVYTRDYLSIFLVFEIGNGFQSIITWCPIYIYRI